MGSAGDGWGIALTVTRRFFDNGCTAGEGSSSRMVSLCCSGDMGGRWVSSLSSSLIRTRMGDWRVASALWLVRNAFGTKIGTVLWGGGLTKGFGDLDGCVSLLGGQCGAGSELGVIGSAATRC